MEKPNQQQSTALAKMDNFSNLAEMQQFAETLILSKLIPATYKSAEAVIATIAQGRELGLPAVTSLYNMHFIGGRPTLSIHAILGLLRTKGIAWKTIKDFEPILDKEGKPTNAETIIRFYRREPLLDMIIEEDISYKWSEATEAGLTSKDTWKAYKKTLLWNRCAAFGARRIAPDVLIGVYETTEMLDANNKEYKLSEDGDITILS